MTTPFQETGTRAARDGLVKLRSFRQCITYPRHRQFRRRYHKLVRQPNNPKALFPQPGVTVIVGKPLPRDPMAWTVNLHNQPTFEANNLWEPIAWAASDPKGGISICELNTRSATILPARGGHEALATATKTPA